MSGYAHLEFCDDLPEEVPLKTISATTNYDVAAELRKKVSAQLVEVAKTLDEAVSAGFVIGFQLAPQPPLGKHTITSLTIAKHF